MWCFISSLLLLALIPVSAQAQRYAPGDTIQTTRSSRLYDEPEGFASRGQLVPKGQTFVVQEIAKEGDYVLVEYKGETGWLWWISVQDIATVRAEEKERRDRIRTERARRDSLRKRETAKRDSLRVRGFGIMLFRLSRGINSVGGITVYIAGENIEKKKTIKYITFTFQLFNPVGDPVEGRIRTPSRTSVRGVGPIKPGDTFGYSFENVWYSRSGDCVELHRIRVEHMDGSTFTYVSDLKPVSRFSEQSINLRGDCKQF